jgi:hypothetical protein
VRFVFTARPGAPHCRAPRRHARPVQNLAFAGGLRTQKQHYETKITLARLAGFVEGGLNLPEPLGERRCALGGVSVPDKIENACGLNHP